MKTPAGLALNLVPLALLALVGLVVWSRVRPGAGGGGVVQEVAATVANAAAGAVGNVASGAVLGVGDAVGVPRTNETACAAALREGRLWDASFACPASDFLAGAWRTVADGAPASSSSSISSTSPGPVFRGAGASGSW